MTLPQPLRLSHIREAAAPGRFTAALFVVGSVTSTNDLLTARGHAGAADGLAVVADRQTAGRGRMQGRWVSPPGTGVYLSVLVRPAPRPEAIALTSGAAGLAAVAAIRRVTGATAMLKWPNDIWVNQRKVGGILIDRAGDAAGFAVIGIGLNTATPDLRAADEGVVPPAGLGDISREALAGALLTELATNLERVTHDAAGIAADYRAHDALRGRDVVVEGADGAITGRVVGCDLISGITLTLADGTQRTLRAEHARVVGVRV